MTPGARAAGVGQASGEETAGGSGSAVRRARSMGIRGWRVGCGASAALIDRNGVDGRNAGGVEIHIRRSSRPDDGHMLAHLRQVAAAVRRPIIIYDVAPWSYPGRGLFRGIAYR